MKKNKKHIFKNICYILILALILTGGLFSLINCNNNNNINNNNAAVQQSINNTSAGTSDTSGTTAADTTAVPTTAAPAGVLDVPVYDKLSIDSNSLVGISQSDKANATDLTFDDIKAVVTEAVNLAGGLQGLVKDGDTVVLKPNLVNMYDYCLPGWQGRPLSPEVNGECADWRVTKAVAQLVRELDPSGKIYVMEGSAADTATVMKALNYTKDNIPEVDEFLAIETDSGKWQDTNSAGLVKVSYPDAL
ncbi:MAG: hypothetical protein FWD71_17770, partial [Oscillospiraceae bacterium]|nr:hypothetical protein [Oscillospiraceae bacterium]